MMTNVRRWIGLAVLAGFFGAVGAAGCSSSTTTVTNPVDSGLRDSGGRDSGLADSTVADSSQTQDSGADSTIADSSPSQDVAALDTSIAPETGGDAADSGLEDSPSDSGLADSPTESGQCVPFDASGLDEASVAAGFEQVWTVYRCQGCHQNASQLVDDAGNGIVLSGNNNGLGDAGTTFPPNLTNDPTTGLGCWTDQQISRAILQGIDNEGGMLCPAMPVWGNTLLTKDGGIKPGTPMDGGTAQEIVDFLRSLPPVVNQVPKTTCSSSVSDAGDGGG
jgi:hypothetical protein